MARRATSEEQKQARRETILETARRLYGDRTYDDVDIATVASESGIAKGTVYLYFGTKEEIFLELLRRAWRTWIEEMQKGLSDPAIRHSIPKVVTLIGRTLEGRPELLGLIPILHTTLEGNAAVEIIREFRLEMKQGFEEVGRQMEEQLGFLLPGEGVMLLTRVHALVIGLSHVASPTPAAAEAIASEEMDLFRVDLGGAIAEMLTVMLMGLKGRGMVR